MIKKFQFALVMLVSLVLGIVFNPLTLLGAFTYGTVSLFVGNGHAMRGFGAFMAIFIFMVLFHTPKGAKS